jgi:hypothetical protein
MLNRVRRLINLAIAILSLADSLAFAGWKGAIVGRDTGGTITADAAGTRHIVTFTAYKGSIWSIRFATDPVLIGF